MSEGNGIIKIGRKGRRKVQFGDDDAPVFEVDVVAVQNAWVDVDREFRDYSAGGDGVIPKDKVAALNNAAWRFVKELITCAAAPADRERAADVSNNLSLAEALEFLTKVTDEAKALARFFEPASSGGPSSPESTELRFST